MLHINDLTYRIEGRLLLEKINLSVFKDQKMGLVGRNGTGKSTLLKLIQQELSPDSGGLRLRKNIRISFTTQESPTGDLSIFQYVLNADKERMNLLEQSELCQDPMQITDIHNRLSDIEAYSAEARAGKILKGLGFEEHKQKMPLSTFSGGWRMRAALASTLFSRPHFLVLDEPTNYLDLEGSLWLKNHLREFDGSLLLISHDRTLLDGCVNSIAHLNNYKIQVYSGNYTQFEKKLSETLERQIKLKTKQENEKRKLQAFVDRFKAKATKASQAQSRVKMLDKMQPIATSIENPVAPFLFPSPTHIMAPPLIRLEDVQAGYDSENPVLKEINLRIDTEDRIGLLGRNGAGKSTFAKLLYQKLKPLSGKIYQHKKIKIGFFTQHQIESLNPSMTPYDHIQELMPEASEAQRRSRLAQFGLGETLSDTKVENLSGGERTRLLLNLIAFPGLHIMILDEPTNHLDMDSRSELAKSLNSFSGSIILISHDEHLIKTTVDRLWLVENNLVLPFEGDLSDYQKTLLKREKTIKTSSIYKKDLIPNRTQRRQITAQKRNQLLSLKREIQRLELELETLQKDIGLIDQKLLDPDTYLQVKKVSELGKVRTGLQKKVEDNENIWFLKTEEYEKKKE